MDDVTLVKTLASVLADRSSFVYRETGAPYSGSEVGIVYGALVESPDRGVGLTLYDAADELATGLRTRRVQLRFRGARDDRTGADALASEAFSAIDGLARVAGLSLVKRVLVAQLGTDENGRQERADSYSIILDNQEA